MISQRAWLIGGVGFCFYLIAIVNTLPSFYYALTWLAVGVLASSFGIALLSLIGLRCAWRAPHAVVSQSLDESSGELAGPFVELEMANGGTLNKTGVLIEVRIARLTFGEKEKSKRSTVITRHFLMEALPSAQSLTTQLPLLHLPRGRYRVEELRLCGSDPLGLFHIEKRVPAGLAIDAAGNLSGVEAGPQSTISPSPEVIVGPATLPTRDSLSLNLSSSRGEGSVTSTRSLGQGDDIRGTRLYTPGDDLRHVHWKSTARKNQLVVKEFHHTLQNRVLVVWDGAADTNWGKAGTTFNTLEWGLALTASLCRTMEERHVPCTLLKLDSQPQHAGYAVGGRQSANAALPNAALTMSRVSELLSEAQADRTSPLAEAFSALPGGATPAGHDPTDNEGLGDIYLVTASLAPDIARTVTFWWVGGARVTVALLHGAAFLKEPRGAVQRLGRSTLPVAGEKPSQGEAIAVTDENYAAQARALRQAGARVVEVAPRTGSSERDVLNAAHHAILHKDQQAVPSRSASPQQDSAPFKSETAASEAAASEMNGATANATG